MGANLLDVIGRSNPDYIEQLYRQYKADPASLDDDWRLLFAGYEFALQQGLGSSVLAPAADPGSDEIHPILGVYHLIHAYRQYGHLVSQLDPLGHNPKRMELLELSEFGFSEADLDVRVDTGSFRGLTDATLGELRNALAATYCRTVGVEFVFVRQKDRWDWLVERMEPNRNHPDLSSDTRRSILEHLVRAEGFERFLHAKYRGAKRFSLEGGESLIPLLDTIIEEAAAAGVEEMAFGMPHRGRLNVLAHTLGKPYPLILAEFEGAPLDEAAQGAGDVKYHKGFSFDRETRSGNTVHLTLAANPSHLESINPVVEGIVWAKQRVRGDADGSRVVPVLMHGDAAFAGQGIVYETLAFSKLRGFDTGGTVHIIINNQVGFTTDPDEYRSAYYSSDVARLLRAPVFHVNADDPEAVAHVAKLAFGYRQAFKTDVFIDLVCYRRHGHNELDDPSFTQPAMYRDIQQHPTVVEVYGRQLVEQGVVTETELEDMRARQRAELEAAQADARENLPKAESIAFHGLWEGLGWAGSEWGVDTRVSHDVLKEIADAVCRTPEGFTPHPRLPKQFEQMRELVYEGRDLGWGAGELLAYGSLLLEGTPVRLTGQDSARGTFSHRHAVLYDHESAAEFVPLNQIRDEQARIEVINSPLSEMAVLGFEYGVASADPRRLVIWEAQFGDFGNCAQVIIDQYIASAEFKWQRQNGIVMLLPHGYEGQGPEHSSARLERFLQLCAKRNMQVVYPSTPAQLFHLLRRQMRRNFRKPLVVMTPKSLLRHRRCVSPVSEFTGAGFQPVLADPAAPAPDRVRRVLLCSGKVYYTLEAAREERGAEDVAIVRIEELYPFPARELQEVMAAYSEQVELCWVQEEHWNQGAWHFVHPILREVFGDRPLRYVGRAESPSPATGSADIHREEEESLVHDAFTGIGEDAPSVYWPVLANSRAGR